MRETAHRWAPITDIPDTWASYAVQELPPLARAWRRRKMEIESSLVFRNEFLEKMRREIAVETGIIERLYVWDRGVTESLIEHGITASLISHDPNDRSAEQIVALIHDQAEAVDWLFDFVARKRPITVSFIRELHQLLTRHQRTTQSRDPQGNLTGVEIIRGDWKKWPNNPSRPDGLLHEYCPPEQVASEVDRLLLLHKEHEQKAVSPEVEAAWLHHRFTQIHPFQDGNGRVVRCLASIVFMRAEYFPLVIRDGDRTSYLDALEQADRGDLRPLVALFGECEQEWFTRALSFEDEPPRLTSNVIESIRARLVKEKQPIIDEEIKKAEGVASSLFQITLDKANEEKRKLDEAFQGILPDFKSYVSFSKADSKKSHYFSYQIGETAKRLNYFANIREYSSWVRLTLETPAQVDILIALHPLGRENFGIFASSACAYKKTREAQDTEVQPVFASLAPLSRTYFQFSHEDQPAELTTRFQAWLDEVLAAGLVYWQRDI